MDTLIATFRYWLTQIGMYASSFIHRLSSHKATGESLEQEGGLKGDGLSPGAMLPADASPIVDGVDYSLPPLLPGWVRRSDNVALRESILNNLTQAYRGDIPIVEDPLLEWDAATRERILSNCHAAYQRNPLAHAAVNFTTDFVIGDGFNLVCKHPQVQAVLRAFIDHPDNAVRKYERQAVNDLQVDGELVLRLYTQGGETVMVPQRPCGITPIK